MGLQKLNRKLARLLDWAIGLIMGAVVTILFVGVIMRYLFNAPLFWSEEIAVMGLIWMTFLGGAILVRQDKNVCITLLSDICPAPVGRFMKILSGALVILMLCIMIYQSWQLTGRLAHATTPALRIKESWFGWAMICGFFIMLYYQILHLIALVRNKPAFPETADQDRGGML
jgi:TRAP-type C4-dicarboxylate transport system permease small subunit